MPHGQPENIKSSFSGIVRVAARGVEEQSSSSAEAADHDARKTTNTPASSSYLCR